MYSNAYVWSRVLSYLEQNYPSVAVTFFDDTEVVEVTDTSMVLYSPTEFRKEMIQNRYGTYIKEAMQELFRSDIQLTVLDETEFPKYTGEKNTRTVNEFNPQYTFDTFVVGSSNQHAYSAAEAVAEERTRAYNPLFLYGPSGLGKTHLLYAIANRIRQKHPDYNIVYIRADQFTNEFIEAVRNGKNFEFRDKYRSADLFLIDDIQFIAGKQQTQEEFFHTFNALYESGHQIVLTSDRPPKEMTQLEDRLRTRFEWGLMVDVEPPDYETRLAIIRNKAVLLGLNLPDRITTLIAENITANVRQIEGALNKVLAYRDLIGAMDEEAIIDAIRDELKSSSEFVPSEENIAEYIARFFNMDVDTLRGNGQGREVTHARQIAMYLIRRLRGTSLKDIGKYFEGRDHTTVLYSLKQVEKKMRVDPAFAETVKEITTNINSKT